MPTKEELQDEVDELRLALEETKDAAESEVLALRDELSASESQRRSLQLTLSSMTDAQHGMRQLYEEKEERLLSRVRDAAAEMAEAGERWAEREEELRSEVAERDSTIGQLQTRADGFQRQLQQQNVWMTDANDKLKLAEKGDRLQRSEINRQEALIERYAGELRAALENRQSIVAGIFELLASRPGCWVVLTCVVGLAAGLVYIINSILSWLTPSPNSLGR